MKNKRFLVIFLTLIFISLVACAKEEPKTNEDFSVTTKEEITGTVTKSKSTNESSQTTEDKKDETDSSSTTAQPSTTTRAPTTTKAPTTTTKAPITTTKAPVVITTTPPVTTTVPTTTKGPKPAKYTVVPAYNFPNDFPRDGWAWRYTTYAWRPYYISWDWSAETGYYVGEIKWEVELIGPASNVEHLRAPQTKENARKFMVAPPTLEESQKMIKYGDDTTLFRYGETNVYVCMEE